MSDLAEPKKEVETPVKIRRKTVSARVTEEVYNEIRGIADKTGKTLDDIISTMIRYSLKKLSEN
ncbi:MAG: hypothetical protein IKN49_04525 [Elusimicrobiaceae bacterium]|nr:hypothetical protein [Candidatus Saccharibacteria bacterium]MBR3204229.1 hypothetical protein [Candidatus Saccharibacteria bacterium]MBR3632301.1 hypothetical protein [Elusimicrobiaceae bacterium]